MATSGGCSRTSLKAVGPWGGAVPTTRQRVLDFFEETRAKGEEAFGDGADNLTGIVAILPHPKLLGSDPADESSDSDREEFGA